MPTIKRDQARGLRAAMTDAERELWRRLRAGQLAGWKFRRQHAIPPYIVDFVCLPAKLVIELDGSQHSPQTDAARTRFLEARGFTILRFWDNDALLSTDAVVEAIFNALGDRTLTPTPLPEGEGL
ncbi:MAG: endonuclease domain-containing protein [Lysobacter sp.]|nr:endonuclease domain-containing protein [Lysobacter sp.]